MIETPVLPASPRGVLAGPPGGSPHGGPGALSPRGLPPGTMQRRVLAALVLFAAVALLFYALRGVILPFAAGLALAYLLDPLADRFERLGIGRLAATLLILAIVVVVLAVVLVVVVPLAVNQLGALLSALPAIVQRFQQVVVERGGPLLDRIGGREALNDLQGQLGDLVGQGGTWLLSVLRSVWSGGQAVVGIVSLLVVTPVVAFYLLVDWDRMVAAVDATVPPRHRPTVRQLARDIDRAIAGFFRGQTLVCLALSTYYALGLGLIGLNFGVLIGAISGMLTFIPYVGTLTGFVLSLGVALFQFWPDWVWIAATVAVYLTGQFLEGNILSPKLVGDAVGLHPVWLMFALIAFGSLFGFLGLLVAVPLAAALGILVRFALRRYRESRLYLAPVDPALLPPSIPLVVDPRA